MISDPLFYLLAVPAVVLLGFSKGGLAGVGSLALPLIVLVIEPVQAAGIMLPILIVQDAVGVADRKFKPPLVSGTVRGMGLMSA